LPPSQVGKAAPLHVPDGFCDAKLQNGMMLKTPSSLTDWRAAMVEDYQNDQNTETSNKDALVQTRITTSSDFGRILLTNDNEHARDAQKCRSEFNQVWRISDFLLGCSFSFTNNLVLHAEVLRVFVGKPVSVLPQDIVRTGLNHTLLVFRWH
jgi:hypothetical protein